MDINDPKNATILVVDDNPTNLDVLSDCLTNYGYTVLLKKDGEKALNLMKRKIPDIILLDIIMPGMNGFETLKRLKINDETKDIPVIFMTALSDPADKIKGFELGAVDYITKPFHQEEVLARIKAHLTIQYLKKNLQMKNKELKEALERERKMMDDLRLNLSISLPHELRTPLNAILGFSSFLTNPSGLPKPEKIVEYGNAIHKGGLRLHRLVENSLLYANLRLLKYAPRERNTESCEMIVDSKQFITSAVQKKAEEIQRKEDISINLENAYLQVSPKNFEKILMELLDNAFKFSSPGTPVQVKMTVNGKLCILTITDQGRGMTKEQIASMGAYMQFDRDAHEQQGSGLGLVITYLLTRLEGGVLSIDSTPEQGTTASIVFNCSNINENVEDYGAWFSTDTADDSKQESRKITACKSLSSEEFSREIIIYIIEKNKENRRILTDILSIPKVKIIEASDVLEALNRAIDFPPDIIFTDLSSLEGKEFEKFRQLAAISGSKHMKLIVFSPRILHSAIQEHLRSLCDDFLIKPVKNPDIIFEKLEIHLGVK